MALLGASLCLALVMHSRTGFYSSVGLALLAFAVLWAAAAFFLPSSRLPWLPSPWVGHFMVAAVIVGAVVVIEAGPPDIDVYGYQVGGAQRVASFQPLNGGEPYADAPASRYYPYMPLEALLRAPFAGLDIRYAGVLALAVSYPLLSALGRVHGVQSPNVVAAVALTAGSPIFILEHAWTEPLILPFLAGGLLALHRWPTLGYVLLGLAAATKLWLLILLPYAWGLNRTGGVIAAAAAFATAVPFLLQDPAALLEGSVLFHLRLPARFDGLTLSHLVPGWPTVVGTVAWLGAGLWLLWNRNPAKGLLVVAAGLACLFFLGKQGNPNYWWFLSVLVAVPYLAGFRPRFTPSVVPVVVPHV